MSSNRSINPVGAHSGAGMSAVEAAMMEELGLGRVAALPAADNGRGSRGPAQAPPQSRVTGADRRVARENREGIQGWNEFTPDDVRPDDQGLDSIANGDLHRRGRAPLTNSQVVHNGQVAPHGPRAVQGAPGAVRPLDTASTAARGQGDRAAAIATQGQLVFDQVALARQLQREFGSKAKRSAYASRTSAAGGRSIPRPTHPPAPRPAARVESRPIVSRAVPRVSSQHQLANPDDFMRTVPPRGGLSNSRYNPDNATQQSASSTTAVAIGVQDVPIPSEPETTAPETAVIEVAASEPATEVPVENIAKTSLYEGRAHFSINGQVLGNATIAIKTSQGLRYLVVEVDDGETYVILSNSILSATQAGCVVTLDIAGPPRAQYELRSHLGFMAEEMHRQIEAIQEVDQERDASEDEDADMQESVEPVLQCIGPMHPLLQRMLDHFSTEHLTQINEEIRQLYSVMLNRTLRPGIENSRYAPQGTTVPTAPKTPRMVETDAVAQYMNRSSLFNNFTEAEQSPFIAELAKKLGEQNVEDAQDSVAVGPKTPLRRIYSIENLKVHRPNATDVGHIPLVGRPPHLQSVQTAQRPPVQRIQAQTPIPVPQPAQTAQRLSVQHLQAQTPVPAPQPPANAALRKQRPALGLDTNEWNRELEANMREKRSNAGRHTTQRPVVLVPESTIPEQHDRHTPNANIAQGSQITATSTAVSRTLSPITSARPGEGSTILSTTNTTGTGINNIVGLAIPDKPIYYSGVQISENEVTKPRKSGLETSRYAHAPENESAAIGTDAFSLADFTASKQCKYGDKCKKRATCQFLHGGEDKVPESTEPCRFLPNCRNLNCPFVHPECKFHPSCTNPACAYTHPKLSAQASKVHPNVFCKYTPCKNPQCSFKHKPGQQMDSSFISRRNSFNTADEDGDAIATLGESLSSLRLSTGGSTTPRTPQIPAGLIRMAHYDGRGNRVIDEFGNPAYVLVPDPRAPQPLDERFSENASNASPLSRSTSRRDNMNPYGDDKENYGSRGNGGYGKKR